MIAFCHKRKANKFFFLILIWTIPSSTPAKLLGEYFSPYVGYSHTYDDNLFRLSDDINEQAVLGINQRSEQIQGISIGLNVDLPISQQRLIIELENTKNNYKNFSDLDHNRYHFLGKFVWKYGSQFKGTIGSKYDKQLNGFEDFFSLRKDLITRRNTFFDLSYQLNVDWRIRGAYSLQETEHGISERQSSNQNNNKYLVDIRYKNRNNNHLGVKFELNDGEYPDRVRSLDNDDQFKQYSARAFALWNITVKSIINAEFGYTNRKWSHISSKDFSSPTGLFEYNYHYSEKLQALISLERDVKSVQNINGSFSLNNSFGLTFNWLLSEKITAQAVFNYIDIKYKGGAGNSIIDNTRHDKDKIFGLSFDYAPFNNTIFSLGYNYKKRTSNIDYIDFDDSIYSLTVRVTF